MNSMSLYQYLNAVSRLWNNDDGTGVSKFISLSGNHTENRNLHLESPENAIERVIEAPLDEVLNSHLKVLFHLHDNRKLIYYRLYMKRK